MAVALSGLSIVLRLEIEMTEEVHTSSDDVFNSDDNGDNQIKLIVEKHRCLSDDLEVLQTLGIPMTREGKETLTDKVDTILVSLLVMKELLIDSARHYLTARQVFVLEMEEETAITDPSIQFFGLEWTLLNKRWQRIGRKVVSYSESLESKKVEMVTLASILKMMNQMGIELHHHQVAVISDQLSPDHLERQLHNQRRVSNIGERAKIDKHTPNHLSLEKGQCFSEKLRRKSFNFNHTLGVSIQHSLRRRPSHQVPKNELSLDVHRDVTRRKSTQECSIINKKSMENISMIAAISCGVRVEVHEK